MKKAKLIYLFRNNYSSFYKMKENGFNIKNIFSEVFITALLVTQAYLTSEKVILCLKFFDGKAIIF
jgi:hypothetical protein